MTSRPRRRLLAASLAASATFVASPSLAQQPQGDNPDVVVTATRTPQPIQRLGSAVTVITAEEIVKSSARDVADLLRQSPGVTVTQNGGPGQLQTVSLRGGEVRHTLVLVDGIRVNDPSSTGREFDFSTIVLADVERIEVLRGPQSALYGSDAMGGVINIITRRGRGPARKTVAVEGGSYATREVRAGVSGSDERVNVSLGVSAFETDGFSAYGFRIPRITRTLRDPLEADGAERLGVTGRLGFRLTDAAQAEFGGSYNLNRAEYDAAFGPFPDTPSRVSSDLSNGYARLIADSFEGRLRSTATVFANRTDRLFRSVSFSDFFGFTTFDTRNRFVGERRGGEYQGDVSLGPFGLLTVGARSETEFADIFARDVLPDPSPRRRDVAAEQTTDSVFALHQVTVGERLNLSFGGRFDAVSAEAGTLTTAPPRDEVFGTGRATAAFLVPESGTKLRGSVGTGAKAPSLYQRFGAFTQPNFGTNLFETVAIGSPDLRSERSVGFDAGVDQSVLDDRLTLSLTAFRNDFRNLIDFASPDFLVFPLVAPAVCDPRQTFGCYYNVARARTSGLELGADLAIQPEFARLKVAYTFLRAEGTLEEEGEDGIARTAFRQLPRRPRNEARIALQLTPLPGLLVEPRLIVVGSRFDRVGEEGRLPSYARFDVYADYKINDTFGVFARAENLTDARYEEVLGYGTAGRSIYAGLRATW
jgi:vitamin B12 transporter